MFASRREWSFGWEAGSAGFHPRGADLCGSGKGNRNLPGGQAKVWAALVHAPEAGAGVSMWYLACDASGGAQSDRRRAQQKRAAGGPKAAEMTLREPQREERNEAA